MALVAERTNVIQIRNLQFGIENETKQTDNQALLLPDTNFLESGFWTLVPKGQ